MKPIAALVVGSAMILPMAAMAGGPVAVAPEPVVTAPPPAPVAPQRVDWTGGYGGVQLGYGSQGSDAAAGLSSANGAIGGIYGGYRWDFGQWVAGVEADYDMSNASGSNTSIDNMGRLKFQVGTGVGQALIYATAGWAQADASINNVSYSDNGWFGGVGMDYQVAPNWTVGGEILTHRFDDFDNTGVDLDPTTVKARVSYRF